ncbi:MAG: hypothetical protein IKE03_05900 [Blautia sp.]|nr:hypothetical protein [Blautia sp.]
MDLKIWKELYELGKTCKDRQIWDLFRPTQAVAVTLKDGQQAYFSFPEMSDRLYFSLGEYGLADLYRSWHKEQLGGNNTEYYFRQDGMAFAFKGQNFLPECVPELLEALGLDFEKGQSRPVFFRYHRYEHQTLLTDEEARMMAEGLTLLLEAADAGIAAAMPAVTGTCIIEYAPGEEDPFPQLELPRTFIVQEPGAIPKGKEFALKSAVRKKSGKTLELSTVFLNGMDRMPFTEEEYEAEDKIFDYEPEIMPDILIRVALLADHMSGEILDEMPLKAEDSSGEAMCTLLARWVEKNGLPTEIIVPDREKRDQIFPLTAFIKVKVSVREINVLNAFQDAFEYGDDFDEDLSPEEEAIFSEIENYLKDMGEKELERLKKQYPNESEDDLIPIVFDNMLEKLESSGVFGEMWDEDDEDWDEDDEDWDEDDEDWDENDEDWDEDDEDWDEDDEDWDEDDEDQDEDDEDWDEDDEDQVEDDENQDDRE